MPLETYFDPFSGTMIEDIGDDDVFVAERDVKIPEGLLVKLINIVHSGQNDFGNQFGKILFTESIVPLRRMYGLKRKFSSKTSNNVSFGSVNKKKKSRFWHSFQ